MEAITTSDEPVMKCLCPRCGITHELRILWTGKGIPKKFCHSCKNAIDKVSDIDSDVWSDTLLDDWRVGY